MAICPYCDKEVEHAIIEEIDLGRNGSMTGHDGVTYSCPHCGKILGVQYDPLVMQEEIAARLKKEH